MERQYRKLEITPDSLLGCRFFDRLERADRAHIAQFCEGRCYRAKTEIIRHGDTSRDVFFILSGQVDARLLTSEGKDLIFQELGRGEMFGELAAIDAEPRTTSVLSKVETNVIRISGPNFKDVVARIPSLAELIMLRICALSRYLCVRLEEVLAYSVPDQIRLEVRRIVSRYVSEDGAVTIESPPTQDEIAKRVGTSREQVTRVMSDFGKRGVIVQSRQLWRVPDVTAIRLDCESP